MKLIDDNEKEIAEINMTPFVDIVLVLLIIFMATATFMVEGKLHLDLPKSKTAKKEEIKENKIEISIKKNGSLYLNDKPVSFKELKEKLRHLKNKNTVVVLRSDKDTKFQDVVSIIDLCKENKLEKFVIETKKVSK